MATTLMVKKLLLASIGLLSVSACQALERRPHLGARATLATIPGFPDVRAVQGYPSEAFQESFTEGLRQRLSFWMKNSGAEPTYEVLVLGAGGPNGAFGAGLLTGWTASGKRPTFDLVTGVSAGALIAPFAFVGSEMDGRLGPVFRELTPDDIYKERGALAGLFGESLMDSSPLQVLIAQHVDRTLLDAVAKAHDEGRRLYVGTTDFDVGQLVVWDLGAIAARRSDEALALFRRVLLASSSIPVFYAPVLFEVQGATGAVGDEMHVDGALASPMFLPHQVFDSWQASDDAGTAELGEARTGITVIHNGSLTPLVGAVARDTVDIAVRSFLMASASMAQGDVLRLYLMSRVWGAEFRFACIPDQGEVNVLEFTAGDAERLFTLGQKRGRSLEWESTPPGYLISEELRGIQPVRRQRD